MASMLRVTLTRGLAGQNKKRRACVRGLGLRHRQHQVTVAETSENLGMIKKIMDMVTVERV